MTATTAISVNRIVFGRCPITHIITTSYGDIHNYCWNHDGHDGTGVCRGRSCSTWFIQCGDVLVLTHYRHQSVSRWFCRRILAKCPRDWVADTARASYASCLCVYIPKTWRSRRRLFPLCPVLKAAAMTVERWGYDSLALVPCFPSAAILLSLCRLG